MHENRETSVAPVQSAGRSEKAQCRNADMHAAEVEEGRPQTEENHGTSYTPPTQCGERVSQGRPGCVEPVRFDVCIQGRSRVR